MFKYGKSCETRLPVFCGVLFLCITLLSGCKKSNVFSYEENTSDDPNAGKTENAIENDYPEDIADSPNTEDTNQNHVEKIYVQVCGMVKNPGVYELSKGDRVFMAIELAGGMLEGAAVSAVNQALELTDGQMIYIPDIQESEKMGNASSSESSDTGSDNTDNRIDINTADEASLCTLPGIGNTKAHNIIAYREQHGSFGSIEEIKSVSGIGEGLYKQIKDRIKAG